MMPLVVVKAGEVMEIKIKAMAVKATMAITTEELVASEVALIIVVVAEVVKEEVVAATMIIKTLVVLILKLRKIHQVGDLVGLLITAITTTKDVQKLHIRPLSKHMGKTEAIEGLEVVHQVHPNSSMIANNNLNFSVVVNSCNTNRSLKTQRSSLMELRVQLQCL